MPNTDMITIIDLLTSKVAMLAFLIVVAKFVSKRIGNKSVDRFIMKIHRPVGYVLVLTGLIHGVASFRVFNTTSIMAYILGGMCFLAIAAAIVTYIFRKKLGGQWLFWHRISTVIALITLLVHFQL